MLQHRKCFCYCYRNCGTTQFFLWCDLCINAYVCAYRKTYAYIHITYTDKHNMIDIHTHMHPEWIEFASQKWLIFPERGDGERGDFTGTSWSHNWRSILQWTMQTCTVERLFLSLPKTGDSRWVWEGSRAQWGNWTRLTKSLAPSLCQCSVCVVHSGDHSGGQDLRRCLTEGELEVKASNTWTMPGLRTYCKRWQQRLPRSEQELGLGRKLTVGGKGAQWSWLVHGGIPRGWKYAEESEAGEKHFHIIGSGQLTSKNKYEKRQDRIRGSLVELPWWAILIYLYHW